MRDTAARPPFLTCCTLALLLGTGAPASILAQDALAPLYQVELIIFAYEDFDPREELFAPPPKMARAETPVPARRERPDEESLRLAVLPGSEPRFGQEGTLDAGGLPPDARTPMPAGEAGVSMPRADTDGTGELGLEGETGGDARGLGALPHEVGDPRDAFIELEQRPLRDFQPFGIRRLRPDELQLRGTYATLNRLGAYTPLVHVGWVQEGLPEGQALVFDLAELGRLTPSGTVRLYLTRFLRLNVDLEYQPRGSYLGPASGRPALELMEVAPPPRYRLTEDRRVRTGELHYFDHPAFGIIVAVRPQPREQTQQGVPPPAP